MPRFSKSIVDLVALFLGGTFLFWLVGHLLQPVPALSMQYRLTEPTTYNATTSTWSTFRKS